MRTLALLTLLSASSAFAASEADREKAFKADIAPILEKSCANCHDPKKAKNGKVKAGFDSSSLKSIVKGGKEAGEGIVWGDASKSSLYKTVNLALTSPEDDLAMPPKKSHEKNPPLTKEQVAKIKAFIEAK
ncbi:MAG TPA: c-type cytochrome domain-containing protein [Burkholderiaceae bacterium]|nr:c-type cytochrome domain-containing protein [Burkholderiaceae bacterium]